VSSVLSQASSQADLTEMITNQVKLDQCYTCCNIKGRLCVGYQQVNFVPCCQGTFTFTLGKGLPERGGGWTPLLLACDQGHVDIVKQLLAQNLSKSNMTTCFNATSLEVSIVLFVLM